MGKTAEFRSTAEKVNPWDYIDSLAYQNREMIDLVVSVHENTLFLKPGLQNYRPAPLTGPSYYLEEFTFNQNRQRQLPLSNETYLVQFNKLCLFSSFHNCNFLDVPSNCRHLGQMVEKATSVLKTYRLFIFLKCIETLTKDIWQITSLCFICETT